MTTAEISEMSSRMTLARSQIIPPGTLVKYLNVEGQHLVGLVVARRDPPTRGAWPMHLVVWSDGHMSEHVYCERLF